MERRRFLTLTAGGFLAASFAAEAQQADKVHRVGILGNVPISDPGGARLWGAFADGLRALGYVDGRNIRIEHLSSEGRYERLPALAADLVRLKVDVIVAPAAQNVVAAKQATGTIPIVMVSVGDPVGNGLVASLARPGGNVTGTSFLTSAMVGKQLDLLKQITPHASRLALLLNPANPGHPLAREEAKVAAHSLGVQLQAVEAREPADFDNAFAAMTRERAGALFVPWDGTFLLHVVRIVQLAAKSRLAGMYGQRRYVDVGGLASYGPSAPESFRNAAAYVDKILKGAKPGDLPVEQPTQFEFVINLKTAKALGLTISPPLLGRADEVIQ
ncbi:MAG TPA: ABC transporter substrate-binding protein [Candidatus Dormibacteraeota bacterium]|nr:ABC transporter substrate-binding protein [Candidatus Dormibacteraeota bacterium]